ncbi:MAG: putative peptidoglycan binding domain, partial [Actinomycetota bacterium]
MDVFRRLALLAVPPVITLGVLAGIVVAPVSISPVAAQTQVSSSSLPRQGDRGSAVVALQKALISAGITVPGGADGVFGRGTAGALAQFQRSVGLAPTGTVDPSSAHLLGLAPAPVLPTRGQRGEAVRSLQNALVAAG